MNKQLFCILGALALLQATMGAFLPAQLKFPRGRKLFVSSEPQKKDLDQQQELDNYVAKFEESLLQSHEEMTQEMNSFTEQSKMEAFSKAIHSTSTSHSAKKKAFRERHKRTRATFSRKDNNVVNHAEANLDQLEKPEVKKEPEQPKARVIVPPAPVAYEPEKDLEQLKEKTTINPFVQPSSKQRAQVEEELAKVAAKYEFLFEQVAKEEATGNPTNPFIQPALAQLQKEEEEEVTKQQDAVVPEVVGQATNPFVQPSQVAKEYAEELAKEDETEASPAGKTTNPFVRPASKKDAKWQAPVAKEDEPDRLLEAEKRQKERWLEAASRKQAYLRQERLLAERLRQDRLVQERVKAEALEQERLEQERLEAERLVWERLEQERLEAETLEQDRVAAEARKQEQVKQERILVERLKQDKLVQERLEAERLEQERLETERLVAERLEAQKLEQERVEAERLLQKSLAAERLEAKKLEEERLEAERLAAEKLEAETLEAEKFEEERLQAEWVQQEPLEAAEEDPVAPFFVKTEGRIAPPDVGKTANPFVQPPLYKEVTNHATEPMESTKEDSLVPEVAKEEDHSVTPPVAETTNNPFVQPALKKEAKEEPRVAHEPVGVTKEDLLGAFTTLAASKWVKDKMKLDLPKIEIQSEAAPKWVKEKMKLDLPKIEIESEAVHQALDMTQRAGGMLFNAAKAISKNLIPNAKETEEATPGVDLGLHLGEDGVFHICSEDAYEYFMETHSDKLVILTFTGFDRPPAFKSLKQQLLDLHQDAGFNDVVLGDVLFSNNPHVEDPFRDFVAFQLGVAKVPSIRFFVNAKEVDKFPQDPWDCSWSTLKTKTEEIVRAYEAYCAHNKV